MPMTKGQMDEPGNESMTPAPVLEVGVLAVLGPLARAWTLPQKKYLWPWNRRCQKK